VAHAIAYRRNATLSHKIGEECGKSYIVSIYVSLYPYRDWLHKAIAKLDAASALSLFATKR